MAEREVIVRLQLNDRNAVADLGRLEIETKRYQKELRSLNAEILKNGSATRQQEERIGTLNASIRRNQSVIRELKNDLSGATAAGLRFRDKMAEASRAGLSAFGIEILSVTALVTGFVSVLRQAINEAEQAKLAQAAVAQAIKTTGGAAGITADEIARMDSALQQSSLFGDDQIMKDVSAQLLTFTNIAGNEFERATAAALDLSTVLGTDLRSTTIQLGKALNDPITGLTALRRVGVAFTEEQREQIRAMVEVGDTAEAQRLILSELERQYGGQAQAAADASNGVKQLQNAFGDLLEQLGDSSFLKDFTTLLREAIEGMTIMVAKSEDLSAKFVGAGKGSALRAEASTKAFLEEADQYLSSREKMILADDEVARVAVEREQSLIRNAVKRAEAEGRLSELQDVLRKKLLQSEAGSREYAFTMVKLKIVADELATVQQKATRVEEKRSTTLGDLRERLKALKEERDSLEVTDKAGLKTNADQIAALEKQIAALDGSTRATKDAKKAREELTQAQKDAIISANDISADVQTNVLAIDPNTVANTDTSAVMRMPDEQAIWDQNAENYANDAKAFEEAQQIKIEQLNAFSDALTGLSDLLGAENEAGKALATAGALVNTYLGATLALTDKTIPNAFARIAAATAVIASGLASVRKIQGFEEGGYTPKKASDKKEVGVVHANEWVAPAWMNRSSKYGPIIRELEQARRARGMRSGMDGFYDGGSTYTYVLTKKRTGIAPAPNPGGVAQADLTRALLNMPPPQLDITEMARAQRRVAYTERASNLR